MTSTTIRDPFPFAPVDSERVDLTEHEDLNFWTREFDCTSDQLVAALLTVGVRATAVRAHLRRLAAAALGAVRPASSGFARGIAGVAFGSSRRLYPQS